MAHRRSGLWWLFAEGFLWTLALTLLSTWAAFRLAGAAEARHELARFAVLEASSQLDTAMPDQSLWSPARVKAWQSALNDPAPAPLGVLRIPRLKIEAPVLAGTDDATLDRGVGHIDETAHAGSGRQCWHRRASRRVLPRAEGHRARATRSSSRPLGGREVYRVERIWIVEPDDVSVLDPTPSRSLTLVTCYPFYYVGSAPQRFIVRAVSVRSAQ